uniref:Uncharacterized protein n=1 Tax=Seriola lalandi dorsalis TaxID=1841481 RepID=A0A3B4XTR8_SERLL
IKERCQCVPRPAAPRYVTPAPASPACSEVSPWTVREWKRIPERLEKPFPQRLQIKGLSPVWIRVWIFKAPDWVKHFPHWLQWGNPLPQNPQEYGLSPVCDKICFCRALDMVNLFPHSLQTYGLSPVCLPHSDDLLKARPQIGHLKGFFSVWAFWWAMII